MQKFSRRIEQVVDESTGKNYRVWRQSITAATIIVVTAGFLNWAINKQDSLDETLFMLVAGLCALAQLQIVMMKNFIVWSIVDPTMMKKLEENNENTTSAAELCSRA